MTLNGFFSNCFTLKGYLSSYGRRNIPPLFRNANTITPPNTPSQPSSQMAVIQPADYDSDHSVECTQGVDEFYALSTDFEHPERVPLERVDDQLDLDTPIAHLPAAVAARRRAKEATQANQTQQDTAFPTPIHIFEQMNLRSSSYVSTGKQNPFSLRNPFTFIPVGIFKMFLITTVLGTISNKNHLRLAKSCCNR